MSDMEDITIRDSKLRIKRLTILTDFDRLQLEKSQTFGRSDDGNSILYFGEVDRHLFQSWRCSTWFCLNEKRGFDGKKDPILEKTLHEMEQNGETFTMCVVYMCNLNHKAWFIYWREIYFALWLMAQLLYLIIEDDEKLTFYWLFINWIIMMTVYTLLMGLKGPTREMQHYCCVLVDSNGREHGIEMKRTGVKYTHPDVFQKLIKVGRGRLLSEQAWKHLEEEQKDEVDECCSCVEAKHTTGPSFRKFFPLFICDTQMQTYKKETLTKDDINIGEMYFLEKERNDRYAGCFGGPRDVDKKGTPVTLQSFTENPDEVMVTECQYPFARRDVRIDLLRKKKDMVKPKQISDLVSNYSEYEVLAHNCQTFASELMAMFHADTKSDKLYEIKKADVVLDLDVRTSSAILKDFDPQTKLYYTSAHRRTSYERCPCKNTITVFTLLRVTSYFLLAGSIRYVLYFTGYSTDFGCESYSWPFRECSRDTYIAFAVIVWGLFTTLARICVVELQQFIFIGEFSEMEERIAECFSLRRNVRAIKQRYKDQYDIRHASTISSPRELPTAAQVSISRIPNKSVTHASDDDFLRNPSPSFPLRNSDAESSDVGPLNITPKRIVASISSGSSNLDPKLPTFETDLLTSTPLETSDSSPIESPLVSDELFIKTVKYTSVPLEQYHCCGPSSVTGYACGVFWVFNLWILITFIPLLIPMFIVDYAEDRVNHVAGIFCVLLLSIVIIRYACFMNKDFTDDHDMQMQECLQMLIKCGAGALLQTDCEDIAEARDYKSIADIQTKYIGIYFGSYSSAACDKFIEKLEELYDKKSEEIEIIFISDDGDIYDFQTHACNMPEWYALDFNIEDYYSINKRLKKICGNVTRIPHFSIFERHSFEVITHFGAFAVDQDDEEFSQFPYTNAGVLGLQDHESFHLDTNEVVELTAGMSLMDMKMKQDTMREFIPMTRDRAEVSSVPDTIPTLEKPESSFRRMLSKGFSTLQISKSAPPRRSKT